MTTPTGGFVPRLFFWPLYLAGLLAIASLAYLAVWWLPFVVGIIAVGLTRALTGLPDSWQNVVAILPAFGLGLALAFPAYLWLAWTGEEVTYEVTAEGDGAWCSVAEVDGDRTLERVSCDRGNGEEFEVGEQITLVQDGLLPQRGDTPVRADTFEKTGNLFSGLFIGSGLLTFLLWARRSWVLTHPTNS